MRFRDAYVEHFVDFANSKVDEHSLIFSEIFQDYHRLLDRLFSSFADICGVTIEKVYSDCRDAMDDKFTPLFEENENKWFVELLLSWMEYDHFVSSMVSHVRKFRRK
jgi:hypothetical protein